MALENEIKATGNALHSLTGSERGVFMFLMLVSLGCIVFLIIYFLQSINDIVADHNKALGEQRKEFIEAQKVRDTEFVTAIYGIKNWERAIR